MYTFSVKSIGYCPSFWINEMTYGKKTSVVSMSDIDSKIHLCLIKLGQLCNVRRQSYASLEYRKDVFLVTDSLLTGHSVDRFICSLAMLTPLTLLLASSVQWLAYSFASLIPS